MEEETKIVFISYSWEVKEKVIELANRLISNGVDVRLDVYDLREGHDKYAFMEQAVTDKNICKVLIICSRIYAEKADSRSGGVGDETSIITSEVYGKTDQEKFIPIIFEKDAEGQGYVPAYIRSRIYIDLSSDNSVYEAEYEKLLRNIYEKPLYRKPALGKKPEWLENETVELSAIRDLIKQLRNCDEKNQAKVEFLIRKAEIEFVIAAKQYQPPEGKLVEEVLLDIIEQFKVLRDLFIDYCEVLICGAFSFVDTITSLIEQLYNQLHDATGKYSCLDKDFEIYDFMIWEFFISLTVICLHYEKYKELYEILTHTYFLRNSNLNDEIEAYNYTKFRAYMKTIEYICKPICDRPNLFTLTGDILVKRERKPILTKESISNADIVLYQMYPILSPGGIGYGGWFPTSYIYHSGNQNMWKKMKSKQFCKKILPLFGVESIELLKESIIKGQPEKHANYPHSFESAPVILDSINEEDIGILK